MAEVRGQGCAPIPDGFGPHSIVDEHSTVDKAQL